MIAQLVILVFIIGNTNAQSIYETYTTTPSTSTVLRAIEKKDISYRLGQGSASIIPVFEGEKWEDDAKNAVMVACQLIEECIPTTYPIKILFRRGSNYPTVFVTTTVRFMSNTSTGSEYEKFEGKYARIPLWVGQEYETKIPSASLKRYAVLGTETSLFHKESTLFSEYDGTVTISPNDIFSTRTDGTVESEKYDLATVAIREIIKILGISSTARLSGSNSLSVFDTNNMLSIYDYRIFYPELTGGLMDKILTYNYATSENAKLADYYPLYSPSTFIINKSLNYLTIDDNNTETLLLQPDLPKETSILNVSSVVRSILFDCGWNKLDQRVGIIPNPYSGRQIRGEAINPFSRSSKPILLSKEREDDEILYPTIEKRLEIENNFKTIEGIKTRSIDNISQKSLTNDSYCYQYFLKDGVIEFLHEDDGYLMGWSFYLIKKDGTLDLISKKSHLYSEFPFDIFDLLSNIPNIDEYARTSDGYLRARINSNRFPISPEHFIDKGFLYNEVQHLYILWYPEKPKLSQKTNYLRVSNDPNSYYKNIEVSMKDVSGVTSARVIQKEYDGSRVYTTSFDVDPSAGYFTTTVDRELRTTLQLVTTNDAGSTDSEIITIQPENAYKMVCSQSDNYLYISFVDRDNQPINGVVPTSARINTAINATVSVIVRIITLNGTKFVDTSRFSPGIYILTVVDSNGRTHSAKFVKK